MVISFPVPWDRGPRGKPGYLFAIYLEKARDLFHIYSRISVFGMNADGKTQEIQEYKSLTRSRNSCNLKLLRMHFLANLIPYFFKGEAKEYGGRD
jgi:hypothetical protein